LKGNQNKDQELTLLERSEHHFGPFVASIRPLEIFRGFKGMAPGKLTGCEDDFAYLV